MISIWSRKGINMKTLFVGLFAIMSGCASIYTTGDFDQGEKTERAFLKNDSECRSEANKYQVRHGVFNAYYVSCMKQRGHVLKKEL